MKNKKEILGQYFTNIETVQKLLDLLFKYKNYQSSIEILEPSFGTGNFIKILENKNFKNITKYEIDKELTKNPKDFFLVSTKEKFSLIVGNPPFSKYNLEESYYHINNYKNSEINPETYLTSENIKKQKEKIENIFILKCIKHLKNSDSTIGFVLPISFFIKNKNKQIKEEIKKNFLSLIIYQNEKIWFDKNIPCCFAIFTNTKSLNKKILTIFETDTIYKEYFNMEDINKELIPSVIFNKKQNNLNNKGNTKIERFLDKDVVKVKKSFKDNNISAKNILTKTKIDDNKNIDNYKIAVVRVGNSSVGKCGLINIERDILNDMFYVLDFKKDFKKNKEIKEKICEEINKNNDYFKKITCRVGSKSIKKEDILNLKISAV